MKSNPVIIGVCVGALSPLSSIIWGLRQRSFSLCVAPYLLCYCVGFVINMQEPDNPMSKGVIYSLQISSGIIAYEISKTLKEKASKKA